MHKKDMSAYLDFGNSSLLDALKKIDDNAEGILFLIDESNRLLGCISDGDIRRFLLAGGTINDKAIKAANTKPKTAMTIDEAKRIYHEKNYVAVPVVDSLNRITDIFMGSAHFIHKREHIDIPVVINAGGKGTRLEPLTKVLPKPLIPIGEYPIMELILKEYQSYGCNDFHIIVNYKRDLIKAYFSENEFKYNITWYDEKFPLGTGGGLSLLKGKISNTFFFANCDALLTANYGSALKFHKEHKNIITVICAYKNMSLPYGIVEMGKNGVIVGMKEKPTYSFLTNTGIYIVEPEVIDDIQDSVSIGFPEIVEEQRKKGRKTAVFPVRESDWMDMGQFPELEKMRSKMYGE